MSVFQFFIWSQYAKDWRRAMAARCEKGEIFTLLDIFRSQKCTFWNQLSRQQYCRSKLVHDFDGKLLKNPLRQIFLFSRKKWL